MKTVGNLCRVFRGGAWNYSSAHFVRAAYRDGDDPTFLDNYVGFRCVLDVKRLANGIRVVCQGGSWGMFARTYLSASYHFPVVPTAPDTTRGFRTRLPGREPRSGLGSTASTA